MEKSGKTTIDQTLVEKPRSGLSLVNEHNHPLLFRERRQMDERKLFKYGSPRAESLSGLLRQKTVKNLRRTCTETSCDFWHPPVCLNQQSESGCMYGDKCFLHTEACGQPSKSPRKVALKDLRLSSLERVDSAPK